MKRPILIAALFAAALLGACRRAPDADAMAGGADKPSLLFQGFEARASHRGKLGGLQAKMEALQNGVRRRYAGDPQAAAQLAGAIQGAVADELDQRRRGGFKTGLDLARKQRPHLVQRDPQTGREISVAPVDGPTGLVGDVNQALRRTGQLPPGFAIEWR
jgi:hypothetical protein